MNDKSKNKNDMIISMDKETGVGCNIVKLSIDDDNITPYNTNGLITMASNKFLRKNLLNQKNQLLFHLIIYFRIFVIIKRIQI